MAGRYRVDFEDPVTEPVCESAMFVPDVVDDDRRLSSKMFRLYTRYRRIASERLLARYARHVPTLTDGELARSLQMSVGSLKTARRKLQDCGYIRIVGFRIFVCNIWALNRGLYDSADAEAIGSDV